jgi:hypothetical protein
VDRTPLLLPLFARGYVGVDRVRDVLVRVPDDLRPQLRTHALLVEAGGRVMAEFVEAEAWPFLAVDLV